MKGRHFSSDAEVIAAAGLGWTDNFLNFFLSGLQKLEQRAKKLLSFLVELRTYQHPLIRYPGFLK
jgi:hypothetical protein